MSLQWRHNKRDGVPNHVRLDCLLSTLFRCRSKNTSMLRVTGLCEGNPPVTDVFPSQRASNREIISIWWRRHVYSLDRLLVRITFYNNGEDHIPDIVVFSSRPSDVSVRLDHMSNDMNFRTQLISANTNINTNEFDLTHSIHVDMHIYIYIYIYGLRTQHGDDATTTNESVPISFPQLLLFLPEINGYQVIDSESHPLLHVGVIIHPCPNINGGLAKPPWMLRHRWMIISHTFIRM